MLYFVDETWQEIRGREVGALAAVAIPRSRYNSFCREVWQIKHNVLGAEELTDSELKGNSCFARSAFKKLDKTGHSRLLQAAEETFAAVRKYGGDAFAIWTTQEEWLLFRNPDPVSLSPPYVALLRFFRRHMREKARGRDRQGLLFFDNRGQKEDLRAAAAIQNYISRIGLEWRELFMQVPHFTPSAVSPGIQAADLVAYLAAHQHDREFRAELKPWWEQVRSMAAPAGHSGLALKALNEESGKRKGKRAGGASS